MLGNENQMLELCFYFTTKVTTIRFHVVYELIIEIIIKSVPFRKPKNVASKLKIKQK